MWAHQLEVWPDALAPTLYGCGDRLTDWAEAGLQLLNGQKAVLIGCSVGGSCALEIARRAPDQVTAMVLCGTKAGVRPSLVAMQEMIALVKSVGTAAAFDKLWLPHLLDERCIDQARQWADDIDLEDLVNGVHAFHTRPDAEKVLVDINCPVHVVSGSQDALPGFAYAQRSASLARQGTLHIVEGGDHYLPFTRPAGLNAIIRTALAV